MQLKTIATNSRIRFSVIAFTYLILALFLIPLYRHQINPDGVAYITISNKYLAGNIGEAINGYWSPLLSLFLLPFLSLSIDPLLAAKLLSFLFGLSLLFGIRLLARQTGLSELMTDIAVAVSVPVVLYFSVQGITPDLLMLSLIVFYLYFIFNPDYSEKRLQGAVCGVFGGIIYLAKSYGFPFFLAHFLVFSVVHYFRRKGVNERKIVLGNLASGLAIFFIISGVWITAISVKYGELTIGTAVKYNFAVAAPDSKGHAIYYPGLMEPEDEDDISVWEDPGNIEVESWSPLESLQAFKHQLTRVRMNFLMTLNALQAFSLFAPVILLVSLLICIPPKRTLLDNRIFYFLSTLLIYNSGYLLLYVLPRYIWLDIIFIVLLAVVFIEWLNEMGYLNNVRLWITLVFLTVSLWINPIRFLVNNVHTGEPIYWLSKEIRDNYDIDGTIVSNDSWNKTYYMSFYNDYTYLGLTDYYLTEDDFEQLKENGIDHYFFWGDPWDDPDDHFEFLEDYEEMTDGDLDELKVFRLRD